MVVIPGTPGETGEITPRFSESSTARLQGIRLRKKRNVLPVVR